jgi:hypothetical protein
MDEDPSNEAFVLSLLEGYDTDEAEAMETEPTPRVEDWRAKYLAWIDRGELPSDRTEARRIARKAMSFTVIGGELYMRAASGACSGASPSPTVGNSFETSTRACVATTRCRTPSWATCSARASIGPPRLLMPTRSCSPVRGANFTHARPISQLTPYRPYPSHRRSPCGDWTSSGPCER